MVSTTLESLVADCLILIALSFDEVIKAVPIEMVLKITDKAKIKNPFLNFFIRITPFKLQNS